MRWLAFSLLALIGCVDHDNDDIVGPYTGARTRFVVDRMVLPTNNAEARQYGADLDGNQVNDNQLGMVIGTLMGQGIADEHLDDRIAGGEIQISVEIQADDLGTDDRAGVWVYGFDGAEASPVGGAFLNGTFVPNFVASTARTNVGRAILPLAILADADASRMEMAAMQISLVPDGNGGYDAQIHGYLRDGLALARIAIEQQLREQPELHRFMWVLMDSNRDGTISTPEWNNSLVASLLAPDIELDDGKYLSAGFGIHLTPCAAGRCATREPETPCLDRVRDGDETDVDCGGSACGRRCPADQACAIDDDCQSGTCDNGVCTITSCFDGVKNGYEAVADCGGSCEARCALGAVCGYGFDCASGICSNPAYESGTGVCIAP